MFRSSSEARFNLGIQSLLDKIGLFIVKKTRFACLFYLIFLEHLEIKSAAFLPLELERLRQIRVERHV